MRKRIRINGQLYEQVPQRKLNRHYDNTYNERFNLDAPIFSEKFPESTLRSKKRSLNIIGRAHKELFPGSLFDQDYAVEPIKRLSAKELIARFFMPREKIDGEWYYLIDAEQVARL